MPQLLPELSAFTPSMVIFDKEGTLFDFHVLWENWMLDLARRLETETGMTLSDRLLAVVGFDPQLLN